MYITINKCVCDAVQEKKNAETKPLGKKISQISKVYPKNWERFLLNGFCLVVFPFCKQSHKKSC